MFRKPGQLATSPKYNLRHFTDLPLIKHGNIGIKEDSHMNNGSFSEPLLDSNDPALFPKLTDEQMKLLARKTWARSQRCSAI